MPYPADEDFALLLDVLPVGVAVLRGEDLRFTLVNPAFQEIDPTRPFLGSPVADAWPELADQITPTLRAVIASGRAHPTEDLILHVERCDALVPEEVNVTLRFQPTAADSEGRRGVLLTATTTVADLAEQRRTQTRFAVDFEAFLEQTSDFVYFKDQESRFRFCSQTLANITHHASWRDMIGKHDLEVFPPETARIYQEEESPVLNEGKPLIGKVNPFVDACGRPGFVQTSKLPLYDKNRKIVGIFGISRDITEQKLADELLRQAHAENERVLAELRESAARIKILTGMLPICSFCNKIRNDQGGWEPVFRYITTHSEAVFSHGLCPECETKHYPD